MHFPKVCAVIVAAGNSSRMNSSVPKVFLPLCGKPVLRRTVEAFEKSSYISSIIVVTKDEYIDHTKDLLSSVTKLTGVVCGGADRRHSVLNGVMASGDCEYVAIHDGARPLVSQSDISAAVDGAIKYDAAAVSVPVKDTVKIVDADCMVSSTPSRSTLRAVFTPQVFRKDEYLAAAAAVPESAEITDDCQLFEMSGKKVFLALGSYTNIKITTPEDIKTASAFLSKDKSEKKNMLRIGHGYDVHRLVEGRKLIIGGVNIEHRLGLLGHSDADVLLHAVSDALLGAAALGDIGHLFPDNDPRYEGISSLILLRKVCEVLRENSFDIVNIDSTVIAQKPKLAPYINDMRSNIAEACGISADAVSVKATTEEGLGFSGTEEGIAAHAVCLLNSH